MSMHPPLASRVTSLISSPTMLVSERARMLRAQSIDVIDMAAGEPDFVTPEVIREASKRALDAGDTHYVSQMGVPALREAIARKLTTENGIVTTASEVLVTPGGKAALFVAIHALVEPGDGVLLPEPAWVSFRPIIELAGGTVQSVPLQTGFRLTRDALRAAVTSKTRVIVVNSPNNPTGRVFDAQEREAIIELALEHDLTIIADEIYERVVFAPHQHVSLAADPRTADRTVTVNGFSKSFAMTGWRIGYLAGPERIVNAAAKLHGHSATCTNSFAQAGAIAALAAPRSIVDDMVKVWEARGIRLCTALDALPAFRCPAPDGAFYAFVDVRPTGLRSSVAAQQLLDVHHLAAVPGDAFGASGAGFLRLSFATDDRTIERAIEAFTRFSENAMKVSTR